MGLADIGRSGGIRNLTGGILQNTQELFKTQLTMGQMASQERSRQIQDNLNIQSLNEKQAQIDRDNRPVFLDDFQARFPQPETAKYYMGILKQGGYVDSIDIGGTKREYFRHKDFKEINELIAKEPQRQEGFLASQLADVGQQKTQASDAYKKAVDKGDSEGAQKLKDQFDALKDKEGMLFESYQKLKKALSGSSNLDERKLEETIRHNRVVESVSEKKVEATKGGGGGTAFQKNVNFLAGIGWDKNDAVKLLTGGKAMDRDTFIGQATLRIMSNEMIPAEEKQDAIGQAIGFFDANISKRGPQKKAKPEAKAQTSPRVKDGIGFLKRATSRDEAKGRIKQLLDKGWSVEDVTAAAKEAGWE